MEQSQVTEMVKHKRFARIQLICTIIIALAFFAALYVLYDENKKLAGKIDILMKKKQPQSKTTGETAKISKIVEKVNTVIKEKCVCKPSAQHEVGKGSKKKDLPKVKKRNLYRRWPRKPKRKQKPKRRPGVMQ